MANVATIQRKDGRARFWGAAFVAAFATMNIPLIPGLGGEYQPVLMLLLGLIAIHSAQSLPKMVFLVAVSIAAALMFAATKAFIQGTFDPMALLRCLVGLFFLVSARDIVSRVPIAAFTAIIWAHGLFAFIGIVHPQIAVGFIDFLGLRGAQSYEGWNAFLASEPSYAVLNLAAVLVLRTLKLHVQGAQTQHKTVYLVGVLILLITKSSTGAILGAILLVALVTSGRKWSAVWLLGGTVVFAGLVVFAHQSGFVAEYLGYRVAALLDVIMLTVKEASITTFFILDPSGGSRIVQNITGFLVPFHYFMGVGNFDLGNLVEEVAPSMVSIINASDELGFRFRAGVPAASLGVFGGIIPLVTILSISYWGFRNIYGANGLELKLFALVFLVTGLVWQGALTAPGWWLVLGAAVTLKSSSVRCRKELPRRLINRMNGFRSLKAS